MATVTGLLEKAREQHRVGKPVLLRWGNPPRTYNFAGVMFGGITPSIGYVDEQGNIRHTYAAEIRKQGAEIKLHGRPWQLFGPRR